MSQTNIELSPKALLLWGGGLLGFVVFLFFLNQWDDSKKKARFCTFYEAVEASPTTDSLKLYFQNVHVTDSLDESKIRFYLIGFDAVKGLNNYSMGNALFVEKGDYSFGILQKEYSNRKPLSGIGLLPRGNWKEYIKNAKEHDFDPAAQYKAQSKEHEFSWYFVVPVKNEGDELAVVLLQRPSE